MKGLSKIIIVYSILLAAGCAGQKSAANSNENAAQEESTVWVSSEPIQCLGNPWEKAWLEQEGKKYGDYPVGKILVIEEPEKKIIKDYYKGQSVEILQIKSKTFSEQGMSDIVCAACTCPQGYTLFLKVNEKDLEKMKEWGYKKAEMEKSNEAY